MWWLRSSSLAPVESNGSGAQKLANGRSIARLGNAPKGSLVLTKGQGKLGVLWFAQASSLSQKWQSPSKGLRFAPFCSVYARTEGSLVTGQGAEGRGRVGRHGHDVVGHQRWPKVSPPCQSGMVELVWTHAWEIFKMVGSGLRRWLVVSCRLLERAW